VVRQNIYVPLLCYFKRFLILFWRNNWFIYPTIGLHASNIKEHKFNKLKLLTNKLIKFLSPFLSKFIIWPYPQQAYIIS